MSGRFLTDLLGVLARRDVRVFDLIGDLPVPIDENHRVVTSVEWDTFCELLRRIAHETGGETGMERCGETLEVLAPARALGSLAGLAASPEMLYRAAAGWVLRRALPGVETRVEKVGDGQLEIHARLAEGLRACPELFYFAAGGARVLPRTIGLGDAVVTYEIEPTVARYRIALPPSPTLFARTRRFFRTIFSAGSVLRYLETQQLELHAKNDALERANLALAESERRYRVLTEAAVDVLCELDGEGRVVYVSSSVEDLIGYSREQVTGSHYRLWFPRRLHGRVDEAITCMREMPAGGTTRERVTLHARGGGLAEAELTARTYDTPEGDRRIVMIVRDLSEDAEKSAASGRLRRSATTRTQRAPRIDAATPQPAIAHVVERAMKDRPLSMEAASGAAWHETTKLLETIRATPAGTAPEPLDRSLLVELAGLPDEIWVDASLFATAVGALVDAAGTNVDDPRAIPSMTIRLASGAGDHEAPTLQVVVSHRDARVSTASSAAFALAKRTARSLGGRLVEETPGTLCLELPQPPTAAD